MGALAAEHLEFVVSGTPKPQGSKVRTAYGMRESGGDDLKLWREAVRSEAADHRDGVFDGPLVVLLKFTMHKPTSAPKKKRTWPIKRPDLDKLCRGVLDALGDAGVWNDDSQVVSLHAYKRFVGDDGSLETPGVHISVWREVD